jgi:hypothetical protein
MAQIGTASHSSYPQTPRRQYITTAAFQNDIYQYTTSVNPTTFEVTGTLTSLATVGTGTAAKCPANRILRENGKKLYPSGLYVANNTTYGAPNPGVVTYMVGVYDPASFLSGYIDPNSKLFAPYNTDKPDYVPRGIDPNGSVVDQGPPVYTLGTVTSGAGLGYAAPSTGSTVTQGTNKATGVTLNAGVGQITTNNATLNAATSVSFTLTNSLIAANDMVIVQHLSGGTLGTYSVFAAAAAGSATITLRNISAGNLSEAVVIQFTVIKNT